MAITSLYADLEFFALNAIAAAGTQTATLVVPNSTTATTNITVLGTSAGASSFVQQAEVCVNCNSSGHHSLAAATLGNNNPSADSDGNICCDSAFGTSVLPSSISVSVVAGGVNVTVTNNGAAANDFVVIYDSYYVMNT